MLKMEILVLGFDNRVASLSKNYLAAKGIIPKSFKSIGQF